MRPALAAAGALVLAGCAQAQQMGYYPDPWSAAYAYVYQPPLAYGLDGRYTPFVYPDGYDGFHYPDPQFRHDPACPGHPAQGAGLISC
jgi:hypothetical protein